MLDLTRRGRLCDGNAMLLLKELAGEFREFVEV